MAENKFKNQIRKNRAETTSTDEITNALYGDSVEKEKTKEPEQSEEPKLKKESLSINKPEITMDFKSNPENSVNLMMEKKAPRTGQAKTFYISTANDEEITRGAERNNCSRSEYLNFILNQVFGN